MPKLGLDELSIISHKRATGWNTLCLQYRLGLYLPLSGLLKGSVLSYSVSNRPVDHHQKKKPNPLPCLKTLLAPSPHQSRGFQCWARASTALQATALGVSIDILEDLTGLDNAPHYLIAIPYLNTHGHRRQLSTSVGCLKRAT